MLLRLHKLSISLESADAAVRDGWAALFEGWLAEDDAQAAADLRLRLALRPTLPPLPEAVPIFSDSALWPDGVGVLRVYAVEGGALLHFVDAGQVSVPLLAAGGRALVDIEGIVGPGAFSHGRFEDVTLTSLAPGLRRRGYFLLHAFAAARNGRCILISGGTNTGKTTTGLNLVLRGWRLLANDAVLLEARSDGVYALPTPGNVGIRPDTFALLPELAARLGVDGVAAVDVPSERLAPGVWGPPARVSAILFPEIVAGAASAAAPLPAGIALARLLAESVDRWDPALLDAHVALLEGLGRQAEAYTLRLGRDMEQLATLINSL